MLSAENQRPTSVRYATADRSEAAAPYLNFFRQRYGTTYPAELDHFLTAIENGTPPAPSFADGRAALVLADAANESLRTGRGVRVSAVGDWSDGVAGRRRRHVLDQGRRLHRRGAPGRRRAGRHALVHRAARRRGGPGRAARQRFRRHRGGARRGARASPSAASGSPAWARPGSSSTATARRSRPPSPGTTSATRAEAEQLARDIDPAAFTRRTGKPPTNQYALTKHRWLTAHVPASRAAVRRFNVAEWVARGLGADEVSERSLASRTGWLDLAREAFDAELLAWSGARAVADAAAGGGRAAGRHRRRTRCSRARSSRSRGTTTRPPPSARGSRRRATCSTPTARPRPCSAP